MTHVGVIVQPMRAGVYLRISQDQTGEQAGVTRQREDCLQLARDLGWTVVDEFVDNDVSATSGKPRPEYRRMLADIKAGRIDAILAWHADRLYRRLEDLQELISVCDKHKIAIRTCRAGELDLSTPAGRMVARILGSVAMAEGEIKSDRWRRSVEQRARNGRWNGSGPRTFGYRPDGTIEPREAEAIRKAARDMLAGVTALDICRQWRAEGLKTSGGHEWGSSALRMLMTNPRIAGLSTLRGEIVGQGQWEPILDRETWEQIRALYLKRSRGKRLQPPRSLLYGIVRCGICGTHLNKRKNPKPIYRCLGQAYAVNRQRHVCISATTLEEYVESFVREKLCDERVRRYVAAIVDESGSAAGRITREMDRIEREITEREMEVSQLTSQRARLAALKAIDELDARLHELQDQLSAIVPAQVPSGNEWPADIGRRSSLISLVVDSVLVHPAKQMSPRVDPSRVEIVLREGVLSCSISASTRGG